MGHSKHLLAVAAMGVILGRAHDAYSCGVALPDFFPADGATNIPTNAKLIITAGDGSSWLRNLGPQSPEQDAGVDASDAGISVYDAGTEVEIDRIDCLARGNARVCIISAHLEPNTRYVWGSSGDFVDYPQAFVTGSGPETPLPMPSMTVELGPARLALGGGDCATYKAARVTVEFEASSDRWLLISGNPNDQPHFVLPGETSATWEALDYERCFDLQQVNFAGEVVTIDRQLCIEDPVPEGGWYTDDASSGWNTTTSHAAPAPTGAVASETAPVPAAVDDDETAPAPTGGFSDETAPAPTGAVADEAEPAPTAGDASVTTQHPNVDDQADADSDKERSPHNEGVANSKARGGCSLSARTTSSIVPGLGMLLLGLVFVRRRRQ